MGYATNADVERRLGPANYVRLTDDRGTGTADEAKVTEARLEAEQTVDSFLGRRYAVPIDVDLCPETASLLRGVVLDLVEFRLFARRPPVPADVLRKRENAVEWLRRAAEGLVVLSNAAGLRENAAGGFTGLACGRGRLLTPPEMEDL